MVKANGFIVFLSKERMNKFLEYVAEEHAFAEPVADFQHSRTAPLVCFVVSAGKLTHSGLERRGERAGTGFSRLNIDQADELSEPLSTRRSLNRMPNRSSALVRKRFESGGLLTKKGFSAVVECVRELAPKTSTILERFSLARRNRPFFSVLGQVRMGTHVIQLLIKKFVTSKKLTDPVTPNFISAVQEALSGLEKIGISGDDIKHALLQGGTPATPDDLRRWFEAFLNDRCKGKDSAKLRFVVE